MKNAILIDVIIIRKSSDVHIMGIACTVAKGGAGGTEAPRGRRRLPTLCTHGHCVGTAARARAQDAGARRQCTGGIAVGC